jgi:DNA polymerase III subunit epsilon
MMRFVAIDFETANNRADSACQLAAVVVQEGKIAGEHSWLIRPPRMYFSPRNISIHGIRPKDVESAPSMERVWDELQPLLDGEVVIAHNARFDIGVLVSSLQAFDVACPDLDFACTRSLARGAWPGRTGYGLKPLGNWLGVSFKHHDALEDARCCAAIALAVARTCEQSELAAVEQALGVRRGNYRQGVITSPRSTRTKRTDAGEGWGRTSADRWGFPLKGAAAKAGVDPHLVMSASAGELPLTGRKFVFLGPLRGLSISETIQLAERLGATCQASITPETNYVVACGSSLEDAGQLVCNSLANNSLASDQQQTSHGSNPQGIRLLSERQFLALIPGGKASTRR